MWDVGLHGLDVGKGISRSTISVVTFHALRAIMRSMSREFVKYDMQLGWDQTCLMGRNLGCVRDDHLQKTERAF